MSCVVYDFLIMTLVLSRAICKLSINVIWQKHISSRLTLVLSRAICKLSISVTWQKHILSRLTLEFSFSKVTEKR